MNDTGRDPRHVSAPTASTVGTTGTRAHLLAAGRKLFAERGFDGTSVRALTTEAAANLGAVTYHFGSKAALYDSVLEETLAPLARRLATVARGDGTALDRLVSVTETYFEHLAEHPELPRLLLQEVAAGKPPPPIVAEVIGRARRTLEQIYEEGAAEGTIRRGHPTLTALSIVAQPVYLTLVAPLLRSIAGLDLTDPATRAVAVEHVTDFVRRGLLPEAADGSTIGPDAAGSDGGVGPAHDPQPVRS